MKRGLDKDEELDEVKRIRPDADEVKDSKENVADHLIIPNDNGTSAKPPVPVPDAEQITSTPSPSSTGLILKLNNVDKNSTSKDLNKFLDRAGVSVKKVKKVFGMVFAELWFEVCVLGFTTILHNNPTPLKLPSFLDRRGASCCNG